MNFLPFLDPVTRAVVLAVLDFEFALWRVKHWCKYRLILLGIEVQYRAEIAWHEVYYCKLWYRPKPRYVSPEERRQAREELGLPADN
jgi:hypothetical protein